ncbi:MAG: SpoIID/LytB domain-containing protein [Bacteroidota bacterium]
MKRIPFIAALLLVIICNISKAQETFLDVKIYTGFRITSLTITPIIGKYVLFENDTRIADVLKTGSVTLKADSEKVAVIRNGETLGKFTSIAITGDGMINAIKIKPLNTTAKERTYDDDIRVSVVNGAFLIINHCELEGYVSGVVQSEGGGSAKDAEFFLVQSTTCRTYALNNMKKHIKDGFNLCDSVHCQLYSGRCKSVEILAATYKTAGDVIVDKDKNMISAAFHSNSGGQTINSEDLWKIPTSYLRSVQDTFSLAMPGAYWEKRKPVTEWLDYLQHKYNYPVNDSVMKRKALNFQQPVRMVYFEDSIPLANIRADLGLRSTFFSISKQGSEIVFKGRGYGHGVGLSQQGAMRMSQLGYTYRDIIRFYYKDVDIVPYESLQGK